MSMFRMIILGAPGSGKGTISKRLVKDFLFKHLSAGDILRMHVMEKTNVGLEAQEFMKVGKLVPNEVMVKLIATELGKIVKTPWILDGFPRTIAQANSLHESQKVDFVLNVDVPNDVIIDRIKDRWIHAPSGRIYNTIFNPPKVEGIDDVTKEPLIQRDDDKPESVLKRLQLYATNTDPITKFYTDLGILKEFHGTETNEIYPWVKAYMQTLPGLEKPP